MYINYVDIAGRS